MRPPNGKLHPQASPSPALKREGFAQNLSCVTRSIKVAGPNLEMVYFRQLEAFRSISVSDHHRSHEHTWVVLHPPPRYPYGQEETPPPMQLCSPHSQPHCLTTEGHCPDFQDRYTNFAMAPGHRNADEPCTVRSTLSWQGITTVNAGQHRCRATHRQMSMYARSHMDRAHRPRTRTIGASQHHFMGQLLTTSRQGKTSTHRVLGET